MRIVWVSDDAYWNTGFGRESFNVLSRLKRVRPDWDMGIMHWAMSGNPIPTAHGLTLLPRYFNDHYSNIKFYIENYKPDFLITLYDVYVSGQFMPKLSKKSGFTKDTRWISYFVFDIIRNSAPRTWQGIWNNCDVPVAMSKYGQEAIIENFHVTPTLITHGVETNLFKPLPHALIDDRRQKWGNPQFVFGGFFRNIHRKQGAKLIEAFSKVCREYPDIRLLLNMKMQDEMGFDLLTYIHHFNCKDKIVVGEQFSPTAGVPLEELNLYYQCCDCQVLPTMGEGFGKPIIEGYAASGLPVIMTHCTTYDELVGDHGLPIKTEGYAWSRAEGAQPFPSVKSMEEQMRVMVDDKALRSKFADYNRTFSRNFDYETSTIPMWIKLLEELEADKS